MEQRWQTESRTGFTSDLPATITCKGLEAKASAPALALSLIHIYLYPHGASINSTLVQVASSIGSSLFVGVLSADVLRGTAAGLAKTQAYADGFAHTLAIAMGIVAVGLVVGFLYARAMRKPSLPKNKKV